MRSEQKQNPTNTDNKESGRWCFFFLLEAQRSETRQTRDVWRAYGGLFDFGRSEANPNTANTDDSKSVRCILCGLEKRSVVKPGQHGRFWHLWQVMNLTLVFLLCLRAMGIQNLGNPSDTVRFLSARLSFFSFSEVNWSETRSTRTI